MTSTTLYRLFNEDLRLLYVGIAGNPGRRFEQHATDKTWWHEVAHIKTRHYPSRTEAALAERQAIQEENPIHNITHNKAIIVPRALRDFDLICTSCNQPGADYLEVDDSQACQARRERDAIQRRRWQESVDAGRPGFIMLNGAELLEGPELVQWQAWHRTCDPAPEASTYWIDADRISRWEHLADWTAHLSEKSWFKHTDWPRLLRGLAHGSGHLLRRAS